MLWPRFGLRTLLAVFTGISLWLGWQAKLVRDRQEVLDELRRSDSVIHVWKGIGPEAGADAKIHFWRRWMGDQPVGTIYHNGKWTDQELRRLFPEAAYVSTVSDADLWRSTHQHKHGEQPPND